MDQNEILKLKADILFAESQILLGEAIIKKNKVIKEEIENRLNVNKLNEVQSNDGINFVDSREKREIIYTDDGETMLLANNNPKIQEQSEGINRLNGFESKDFNQSLECSEFHSCEISENDFESSDLPVKFLLDDFNLDEVMENFPDEDELPDDFDSSKQLTRQQLFECLEKNEFTIEKFLELIDKKIEYKHGDFLNLDDYRYGLMYIVGKNGVLYRNPDNSSSGGISIEFQIAKYYKDSIKKFGDYANDIELGYYDINLNNYETKKGDDFYKYKYVWICDGEVESIDKNGNSSTLEKKIVYPDKKQNINKTEEITKKSNQSKNSIDKKSIVGKTIVFTGGKDKELLKKFDELNVSVVNQITKSTNYLITKSKDDESTKMIKAKENNIPIYTVDEVKQMLN